jgi:hypothetical protein
MESGLDSIALAAAHLERTHVSNEHPTAFCRHDAPDASVLGSVLTTWTMDVPLPSREPFAFAPRVVSEEVFVEQTGSCADVVKDTTVPYPRHHDDHLYPPPHEAGGLYAHQDGTPPASVVHTIEANGVTTAPSRPRVAVLCPRPTPFNGMECDYSGPTSFEKQSRISTKPLKDLKAYFRPSDFSSTNGPPVPLPTDIFTKVRDDDVIFGRGGSSNHHAGNVQYRMLVKACQPAYLIAKRRDKPKIAAGIVLAVRKAGGRFLKKELGDNTSWTDVGNTRAREKTSQALREGAPELREGVPEVATGIVYAVRKAGGMVKDESGGRVVPMGIAEFAKTVKVERPKTGAAPMGMTGFVGKPVKVARTKQPRRHTMSTVHDPVVVVTIGDQQPPAKKKQKRRSSLESLADAAVLSPFPLGGSPAVLAATTPAWESSKSDPSTTTTRPVVATVSGDDEDSSSSSCTLEDAKATPPSSPPPRGPRIKLLKQRLQDKSTGEGSL